MVKGYLLPEEIDPERICFTIQVPNEPAHIRAFFGALHTLTQWWNWERDDDHTGTKVGRVWKDVIDRALAGEIDCGEETLNTRNYCRTFLPRAPFINFAPNSPFRPDEEQVPPGYGARPWFLPDSYFSNYPLDWLQQLGTSLIDLLQDLRSTDVLSLWLSQPAFSIPSGFPRFEVAVRGVGEVELHLLNVPLGGRALVTVDFIPDIDDLLQGNLEFGDLQIIETNWDAFSFPPETAQELVHEITLDTPGDHTIYVTALPVLNDELVFVQYGMGLRSVVLCGDDLNPIWPEGTEGEGEINMADPCGCDGIEDIVQRVGLALAFGLGQDYSSGTIENGEVTIGNDDEEYIPEDPEAPGFTEYEPRAGAAWKTANRLAEALADIYVWMFETTCWDGLNWLIPFQEECYNYVYQLASAVYDINQDKLNEFMLYVVNDTTATYVVPVEDLAAYFFCVGSNQQAVGKWAVESLPAGEERTFYLKLREVFNQGQYAYWRELGEQQPRTDYQQFPCVLRPTIEYTFAPLDIGAGYNQRAAIPNMAWAVRDYSTIVYITLSGTVTDGTIQEDPLYRFDGGQPERRMLGMRWKNEGNIYPDAENFPPYNEAHSYTFSVEMTPNEEVEAVRLFWDASIGGQPYDAYDSAQESAVGSFKIRIADGGEI